MPQETHSHGSMMTLTRSRAHKRVHHVLFATALLFCCAAVCPTAANHRCSFDDIARKVGPPSRAIMLELPRRGRSGVSLLTASVSEWAPIRIRFFTKDLEDKSRYCTAVNESRPNFYGGMATCREDSILTSAKRNIFVRKLLPRAIKLHAERLLVQPMPGRIFPSNDTFGGPCPFFAVPSAHYRKGIENADMVLYVAAGPVPVRIVGWSHICATDERTGRPLVGVINFNPAKINLNDHVVRAVAHEIAHTLGFTFDTMQGLGMITRAAGVRGKAEVLLVSTPKTLEKAKAHYNCPTAPGMELEDEGSGGTRGSHWEMRNAKDELMAGLSGIGYYTALTMAAFEDMGFYRANWSMAETMNWGKNSGCRLLTEKCFTNGVTAYPDMFCSNWGWNEYLMTCTSDRLALGFCANMSHENALPMEYQYLNNINFSGYGVYSDYCSYVIPFWKTDCTSGKKDFMRGSRVGRRPKCLKGHTLRHKKKRIGDVCAEVRRKKGTVSVRYVGDNNLYACPEGNYIKPGGDFTSGKIVCPKYSEVCIETGADKSEADLSPMRE